MITDLAENFYANNVIMASTELERLQRVFDVLTSLFDWVGLRTNAAKTVGMVCQPCHAPGGGVRGGLCVTGDGEGPTFWES